MAVTALLLAGFASISSAQSPSPVIATTSVPADFLTSNLDLSVDPGKDFFDYANGGWFARNPIPASEANWGVENLVQNDLYAKLRAINEEAAAAHAPAGSDQQKIGDFWTAAMDEPKADALGVTPLDQQLALIDSIKTLNNVIDAAFALRSLGVGAFAMCRWTRTRNKAT